MDIGRNNRALGQNYGWFDGFGVRDALELLFRTTHMYTDAVYRERVVRVDG